MSALWYEYLEESGGEVIATKYFSHVCRSLELGEKLLDEFRESNVLNEVIYGKNHKDNLWWPIKIVETLSEGWLRFEYIGVKKSKVIAWFDTRNCDGTIKTIQWCVEHGVQWYAPFDGENLNVFEIIENVKNNKHIQINKQYICSFERIKIGGYLECWHEQNVGLVWPVRVLGNIGGRVRLAWFGCESAGKHGASATFVLFYLDQRLRGLGWARSHGWRYSAPENAGIVITISNADTFARGSPGALPKELCNESEPENHLLKEGWQIEAVDPFQPDTVRPAFIKHIFDQKYFLVELDVENDDEEPVRFPGYAGLATLLPANLSGVSGYVVRGLHGGYWHSHLMQAHTDRYAPHQAYFSSVDDTEADSAFLPGCKLEAVNPWKRDQIHAATVTRCMDGSRLVWVRLDTEPDLPDFLVDPCASVDLFPVGWCEMVHHPLVLPVLDPPISLSPWASIDNDDVTLFLHPQCFLGPFLSRSMATQILPRFIGPGHCLPVFRELFNLLLKVSHKPHKLKKLLQLDNGDDHRDLMATIAIPSPKSEHSQRQRRPDWLVEVAVRKRAIPEFCRQTALSLGACPWFLTTEAGHRCSLHCEARLAAKAGEKMSLQRRKRLLQRPLTVAGLSYRTLKARITGGLSNSGSSNSDGDSTDGGDEAPLAAVAAAATEGRVQTRGVRVPALLCGEARGRCARRKPLPAVSPSIDGGALDGPPPLASTMVDGGGGGGGGPVTVADLSQYAIDPGFLAGDMARITLASNPIHWTADQVSEYLATTDCRQLASWLANEKVDGPAFLLLTLPVLCSLCGLQLEPAIRLCRHVVSLKRAFVEQFAEYKSVLPPDL